MTKITIKETKYHGVKVYEGVCNGKNYGGSYYMDGLKINNGYVVINGEVSCKKKVQIDASEVTEIVGLPSVMPTTVQGWMKEMERSER